MLSNTACADHIALLAPVPEEHLHAGKKTTLANGKVAFGSRASDVFINLSRNAGTSRSISTSMNLREAGHTIFECHGTVGTLASSVLSTEPTRRA